MADIEQRHHHNGHRAAHDPTIIVFELGAGVAVLGIRGNLKLQRLIVASPLPVTTANWLIMAFSEINQEGDTISKDFVDSSHHRKVFGTMNS